MHSTGHLRELRDARGLKLREAARRARIDASHLSRVEQGKTSISLAALVRLAGVLELDEPLTLVLDLERLTVLPVGYDPEPN